MKHYYKSIIPLNTRMKQNQYDSTQEKLSHYMDLYEHAPVGYITLDYQGKVTELNTTAQKQLGVTKKTMLNSPFIKVIDHRDKPCWLHFFSNILDQGVFQSGQFRLLGKSKIPEYYTLECQPIFRDQEELQNVRVCLSGVNKEYVINQTLGEQSKLLKLMLANIHDLVALKDRDFRYTMVSDSFCDFLGKSADDIVGKDDYELFTTEEATNLRECDSHTMRTLNARCQETQIESVQGRRWLQIAKTPVTNNDNDVIGVLSSMRDITAQKQHEKEMWYQANYDILTGLPNRKLFYDRLHQEVRSARRKENQFALMFIDIDQFKSINDTLGHHTGDLVLAEIANRLKNCARETDTVARLSGDEFTIILPNIADRAATELVANKILEKLTAPYSLFSQNSLAKQTEICSSASLGITLYPNDASDEFTLLRYADLAMYRAKSEGGNSIVFFNTELGD